MLSPLMLLGVLGLGIPIAIHLIQKQRLKPQPFAAIKFLDKEDVANSFAPVPRDVLQLLLRLILMLMVILLLARLSIPTGEPGPRTMVLILDQSMSMKQLDENRKSLYGIMKSRIKEMLQGMKEGDRASLMFVGDHIVSTGFTDEKDQLLETLDKTTADDCGGLALMPAIRESINLLHSRIDANPMVIVFSDHQKLNYRAWLKSGSDDGAIPIADLLSGSRVKLVIVDPGNEIENNVGIEKAEFSSAESYLGASARMTVLAKNHSDQSQNVVLTFNEGSVTGAMREITLSPKESAWVDLVHLFQNPVDSACKVTLNEDDLPGDNQFHLPMRMKGRTQILMVAPAKDEKGERSNTLSGSELLAYALNPGEALGDGSGTYINVKRITPNFLSKQSLPLYTMVILYGVSDLGERSKKDLLAYVQNGGGLLIILKSEMSPSAIQQGLGDFLGGTSMKQINEEKVQGINRNESTLGSPLLYPLIRSEWGELESINVSKYFGVEVSPSAHVLLQAANGDPLLLSLPMKKGRVVLQSFDCELDSSSFPRSSAFVSMYQEIAGHLNQKKRRAVVETMRTGDILNIHVPEFSRLSGNVDISGPQNFKAPIFSKSESISFKRPQKAGAYGLSHVNRKSGRKHWVTVNHVAGESDLKTINHEELRSLFGDSAEVLSAEKLEGLGSNRREIIPLMLLLVFLAFLIEAIVGTLHSRSKAPVEVKS